MAQHRARVVRNGYRWVMAALCGLGMAGAVTVMSAAGSAGLPGGSWPAFRGPLATGVSPDGAPPAEWSETKNVRWKAPMPGEGHATPIVWKDRIYVLAAVRKEEPVEPAAPAPASPHDPNAAPPAAPDPNAPAPAQGGRGPRPKPTQVHQFTVLALDRATGSTVWSRVVTEEIPHESGHQTSSQASASPVTDGERLYAFFGSRGLFALDMGGKVLWKKDLGDMRTRNEFGEGASPALHGDTLVVNWDHEGDDFIVALDKRTGEERWRVARDEPTSWSTPLIVQDGERALVVVSATKAVRAYDLKDGSEVWRSGGLGANCIPTPVSAGGLVFVMSGYQNPAALAIRYPGAQGDITGTDRIAWRLDRGTSYVASPLLYDGTIYFVDRFSATLSARDFATGAPHYTEQRVEGLGNVYASPVGAAGRIYLVDRDGKGMVLRKGAAFEVVGTGSLDDTFDASPVVSGDTLLLRGHKSLYAIAAPKG